MNHRKKQDTMDINRREALRKLALSGIVVSFRPLTKLFAGKAVKAESTFFKYVLNPDFPRFDYISVDSLGKSKLDQSPLLLSDVSQTNFLSENSGGITRYFLKESPQTAAWEFIPTKRGFILRSNFVESNVPWVIKFNQRKNHATVLGLVPEMNKITWITRKVMLKMCHPTEILHVRVSYPCFGYSFIS